MKKIMFTPLELALAGISIFFLCVALFAAYHAKVNADCAQFYRAQLTNSILVRP